MEHSMNGRYARQALVAVILVVAAVAIALVAYNVGYTDGAAAQRAGTIGSVPFGYFGPWGYRGGFGFGLLGLLFPILFFFLIFAFFRAIFWGGPRRYGRWEREPWQGPSSTFESWHRQAHGEPWQPGAAPGGPGAQPPAGGSAPGPASGGPGSSGPGGSGTTTF